MDGAFGNDKVWKFRLELTLPPFQWTGMRAEHLLREIAVSRFDGDANPTIETKETVIVPENQWVENLDFSGV